MKDIKKVLLSCSLNFIPIHYNERKATIPWHIMKFPVKGKEIQCTQSPCPSLTAANKREISFITE